VHFDTKLSFKDHITYKICKSYRVLGISKRNCINVTADAFVLLYESLIRSSLAYASGFWNLQMERVISKD